MTKPEQLVTCTFCSRSGFTRRGLRSHWCDLGKKGAKTRALTQEEWKNMADPPPTPKPPPKVPSGPDMMDMTCGACGHQGDWNTFLKESPCNEFRCPNCKFTWQVQRGELERTLQTPDGPLPIYARKLVKIDRPIIRVPAVRLQSDLWFPMKGDIAAACVQPSGNGKVTVRKTFEHDGRLWVNWGGSENEARCTTLTLIPPGMAISEKRPYCHENEVLMWKGKQYVCGPEVEFVAEPRGPGSEADRVRRMYAFGGMFAAEAGSYRGLLTKWLAEDNPTDLQRIVWEAEIAADLPQTQQGMRELIGEVRPGEPPRFNPLTGKTS